MKKEKTNRGFAIIEFKDEYGIECSLQKSSLADKDAIWFGCNEANPRYLEHGTWKTPELPEGTVCNTRMHLTQKQVKKLLPHLQKFVETGDL